MRIIIYGAGAIGGVVGGHLARVGYEVVMVGRGGHVQAINEHGLHLITPSGTFVLRMPAVTDLEQVNFAQDDVVFLCMKGQDTERALQDLKSVVSDIPVFCLQNGVENEETAVKYFPQVYGVMMRIGAVYLTAGQVTARRDPPGWVVIGCYPHGTDARAEAVGGMLRSAGFIVLVSPDVMPYKWGKLMDNLGNAVGAITNGRGEDVAVITRAAQKELRDLLIEAGMRWVSAEDAVRELPEIALPPRATLTGEAQSSTWQSLTRRTGTIETESLNGEVVRLAKQRGGQAPINEKLVNICLEMSAHRDLPGKYTPAQLRQMLGIS